MKINYCLILGAGFGTRMGEIGKKLPKVLWPIFEKSLIQLQIDYAKSLGCDKIYINTHFGHNQIIKHLDETHYLKDVIILHEETILGAGGAIHNLAKRVEVNYDGNLLTLNADQFFFMPKAKLLSKIQDLEKYSNILFGLNVSAASGYGQVLIENELMKDIVEEDHHNDYYTYSGVGVTQLNKIEKIKGVSRFFDSVANYKNVSVKMLISPEVEYWDFGTINRYYSSMFGIIKEITSDSCKDFINFLVNVNALDINKMKNSSYGSTKGDNVIFLSSEINDLHKHEDAIIINSKDLKTSVSNGIFYKGILEKPSF